MTKEVDRKINKKLVIPTLLGILLLIGGVIAANAVTDKTIIGPSPEQQNKLIPAAQPSAGLTDQQIQQANQIISKEIDNITNNL